MNFGELIKQTAQLLSISASEFFATVHERPGPEVCPWACITDRTTDSWLKHTARGFAAHDMGPPIGEKKRCANKKPLRCEQNLVP